MFVYLIAIAIPIISYHIQFLHTVAPDLMTWQMLGSAIKYGVMANGVYMVYKELREQQAERTRQQMAFTLHAFNILNRHMPNMETIGISPKICAEMRSQNLRDRSELIRILQLVHSEKSPNEIAIIADEMLLILNK